MIYDFNKNKYHVPGSGKRSKLGSSPPHNQTKSLKLTRSQYTGNELIPPLGEVEDSRSIELPPQIKTPTEIAAAVVALAVIPIGEIIILFSLVGLALTVTWKDEKTGKEYTIGSYTLEQIVNAGNFVAQLSADIYNAVGDKIAEAGMTLEKFTKIVDENLGKIPGFPGTSDQVIIPNDTAHTGNETEGISHEIPGFDTQAAPELTNGGFKPVRDYIGKYVFTIQEGGDKNYDENEIYQEVVRIASRYKVYKCIEAANAIQEFLESRGVPGKRITIDTGIRRGAGGLIGDAQTGENIADNGIHEGIIIQLNGEEIVIDNINHEGLPVNQWLGNIIVTTRPNVIVKDF